MIPAILLGITCRMAEKHHSLVSRQRGVGELGGILGSLHGEMIFGAACAHGRDPVGYRIMANSCGLEKDQDRERRRDCLSGAGASK